MNTRILFFAAFAFLLSGPIARSQETDTAAVAVRHWITDKTGTLTPDEINQIDGKLAAFQRTTSNQIVVLMIPSLNGRSLEDLSLEEAELNKVGRKEKNNGVLVLIAKNDRRIRFEVGYGLEGVLTDALSDQIIRHQIAPRFRAGDFAGGIADGVQAIMDVTKGEYTGGDEQGPNKRVTSFLIAVLLFVVFGFLRIFSGGRRRFLGSRGISSGPFWFGGFGGGGGGGFGGFSGGGGGFGGGGASGGW